MKNKVFLDTAFAIALSVESDEHHNHAVELSEQLEIEQTQLVTTVAFFWKSETHCQKGVIVKPRLNY